MVLTKSEEHVLEPGSPAPEFSLKNIDNEIISLSQFKGTPVAIIFMCNHCPFVKPKMTELADLSKEFKDKVVIIGINSNDVENYKEDSFENMQKVAKEFDYEYYLLDETQQTAKDYGAVCTPDPFLFDKDHNLVFHGRINDAMNPDDTPSKHDLREAIQTVLNNDKVNNWFVPSMGCNIKWK